MIYLNLAEALNPVSTLSLSLSFFCNRIQIRTSSKYVLNIFTISYTLRSSSEISVLRLLSCKCMTYANYI